MKYLFSELHHVKDLIPEGESCDEASGVTCDQAFLYFLSGRERNA